MSADTEHHTEAHTGGADGGDPLAATVLHVGGLHYASGSSVVVALNVLALKATRLPGPGDGTGARAGSAPDAPADQNALHAAG